MALDIPRLSRKDDFRAGSGLGHQHHKRSKFGCNENVLHNTIMQEKMLHNAPTEAQYSELQQAFDWFNVRLFGGKLPQCLITLQRKSGAAGYYSSRRFVSRPDDGARVIDEIAINPESIPESDLEFLQTLVHEQCHQWQFHYGRPSRGRYHNREWANMMETIGLMPSSTGVIGGDRVGQKMMDYVITGGLFECAAQELLITQWRVGWEDISSRLRRNGREVVEGSVPCPDNSGVKTVVYRSKYECPACRFNAWAKKDARLICGNCTETLQWVKDYKAKAR